MAKPRRPSRTGRKPAGPPEPLLRALDWAGIMGFPGEIWATIATALAPDGVTYRATDVESFARAHPKQVHRYVAGSGSMYSRERDSGRDAMNAVLSEPHIARSIDALLGPNRVEDRISTALVALYRTHPANDDVRSYLHRCLPDWCADGTGAGLDALRAAGRAPDVDYLLGGALLKRAAREPAAEGLRLQHEAIERFEAAGHEVEAAEARRGIARSLRASGELDGAVREMERARAAYRVLARTASFHLRFVALTELELGILYREAGRRRDAVAATKAALAGFQQLETEDHRFADEVAEARRQLRQIRWGLG
jgi:tetratricopeptide (TPR) repeat protein